MPVVIVEGTCGSGKTTLLRATHSMFDREVVVLDQKTTYAPIAAREDAGTLDDEYNRRALHAIVRRIRDEHVAGHLVLEELRLHARCSHDRPPCLPNTNVVSALACCRATTG